MEAGAEFEGVGWVGRDGEDLGGNDIAWQDKRLCGHVL